MTAPTKILDPVSGLSARVTKFGQLVTSPIDFSTVVQIEADATNTAFSLLSPTSDQQIVITDIILTANRSIGVNDATVDLYLADSPNSIAIEAGDSVLSLELEKNGKLVLTGLNLITDVGKWINIKTNDATIFATLMYYRVPVDDM